MEFAISVPLLVVLVVGIYDFAQAFNVKQKLNFAVKDGARFGATQPTNDLSQSTPASVVAIRDLVDADLIAEGLDDCGLGKIQPVAGTLSWTATGNCFNRPWFYSSSRGKHIRAFLDLNPRFHQLSVQVAFQRGSAIGSSWRKFYWALGDHDRLDRRESGLK